MKQIGLTQGHLVLIDAIDYEWLNQWKWSFSGYCGRKFGYAVRRTYPKGRNRKSKTVLMHRLITECPEGMEVDHINGNRMDCRRSNLRVCTRLGNTKNRGLGKNNTSGFKGVSWHKINGVWTANIRLNKKRIHLGSFKDKTEAAKAYDKAAIKYFGEFARLNFSST